jgi:aldehyde dehydrogenase (NAD+)
MGETIPVKGNHLTYTLREPVGVVAAIVPWNFPLLLAAWKIAPALACGNAVIVKPASQTPLTALALGELAIDVGFPPGVLNVITGAGSTVGQALVEHPGIDKIAFTGDTSTGRSIMRGAAGTLKKITLELGGKSPNIVLADADIDAAIRGATIGIFYGKGEVCAAGSRLLVDRSIKDEFLDKLAARAKKMVPGDPLDPKTRYGAISSRKQLDTVLRYIESGKTEGATLLAGGVRADIGTGKGYFVQPTVFSDVKPSMTISRSSVPCSPPSISPTWTRRSQPRTTRHTVSPPVSGHGTSRRPITSPVSCRRARSGSTPTTSTTPPLRSAATSRADSAAR